MYKFLTMLMVLLLLAPATVMAATIDDLQEQLDELSERLESAERHAATDRISWYGDLRTKAHSLKYEDVTFNPGIKVDFTDFFTKVGGGQLGAPNIFTQQGAFDPTLSEGSALDNMFVGLSQNNPAQFGKLMQAFGAMQQGVMPGVGNFDMTTVDHPRRTYDIKNSILYTTRMRLGMKAKVADNMTFAGRLGMFKNWGDSTGS